MPPSGRPAQKPTCRIAAVRRSLGLTQAGLARQVGLSRQFLNQMESGRTLPNVAVALHLAEALGTLVEELFPPPLPASQYPAVRLAEPGLPPGARVRLGRVGGNWAAHPAETAASLGGGITAADGVLVDSGHVRLLRAQTELEANVLLAGCDPALRLLQPTPGEPGQWHWIECGSGRALDLLQAGLAHVAGIHYSGPDSRGNRAEIARRGHEQDWSLVGFTSWEQGWLIRPAMAGRFVGARTLQRDSWVLANRHSSAAARQWLDHALAVAHVTPATVRGYDTEYRTANDAARAVAETWADVTIGPKAVAVAHGLLFKPAEAVSFDLVAPRVWWQSPTGRALKNRIQFLADSGELDTLPGYSPAPRGIAGKARPRENKSRR